MKGKVKGGQLCAERGDHFRWDFPITFTDVVLKVGIDLDSPWLLGFLLNDGECGIVEEHCPCKTFRITYSQSEERTAADI